MPTMLEEFKDALLGWKVIDVLPNQHSEGGVALICRQRGEDRRVDVDYGIYGPVATVRNLYQGQHNTVLEVSPAEVLDSVDSHASKHDSDPNTAHTYAPMTLDGGLVGIHCVQTGEAWVAPRDGTPVNRGSKLAAWARDDETWARAAKALSKRSFLLFGAHPDDEDWEDDDEL